jgi:hypothetical protein
LPDVGKVMILPPSKLLGSAQAEGSDWINVLNAQEVFLEDAGDIQLAWHQNHRPFLNVKDCISFDTSQDRKLIGVSIDGSQHGFNLSIHMPMVTVTHALIWFCMHSPTMLAYSSG